MTTLPAMKKSSLTHVIKTWKLNQAYLSRRMNMPVGTFKNKLNERQTAYHFTDEEKLQLTFILKLLAKDIQKL